MANQANWNGKCISCNSRMFLKEIFNMGMGEYTHTNLIMKCLDENKTGCKWYHWVPVELSHYDKQHIEKMGVVETTTNF
jgi:hypothetical protein